MIFVTEGKRHRHIIVKIIFLCLLQSVFFPQLVTTFFVSKSCSRWLSNNLDSCSNSTFVHIYAFFIVTAESKWFFLYTYMTGNSVILLLFLYPVLQVYEELTQGSQPAPNLAPHPSHQVKGIFRRNKPTGT